MLECWWQMIDFSSDASTFLNADARNTIAVHCKGGKGRTGTMVCAQLLRSGESHKPHEALHLFADKRTHGTGTEQGVSGPSQIRFVE